MSFETVATITSPKAARYMKQLCKHFAHKIPTEFDDTSGKITFGGGECLLASDGETLTLRVVTSAEDDLLNLRDVVERHLVRFAFREDQMDVHWQ